MDRFVVDASAIAEYLFRTDRGLTVQPLIEATNAELHVPALCDLEVLAAVRSSLRRGIGDAPWAEEILRQHLSLPLIRHGHQLLVPRAFELRDNLTPYDAAYIALAERLSSPLVTADASLARAAHDHTSVDIKQA
jgi:predicted nucleic acid-binding protein